MSAEEEEVVSFLGVVFLLLWRVLFVCFTVRENCVEGVLIAKAYDHDWICAGKEHELHQEQLLTSTVCYNG